MAGSTGTARSLTGRSATLFLLAGALLAVFAANTGARVFADGGVPAVHSVLGPAGFFLGTLGLLARSPTLAGERPPLARVAGLVTAIPVVGWFAIATVGLGNVVGVLPGLSVLVPPVVPMLVFLTTVLAYLLVGLLTVESGALPRPVGLALVLPAVPFLGLIVGMAVLGPVAGAEFVVDAGHAAAHLAVGLTLRTRARPTESGDPAVDPTP